MGLVHLSFKRAMTVVAVCANLAICPVNLHCASRSKSQAATSSPNSTSTLEARLGDLISHAGGRCGVSVMHIESGKIASVNGTEPLPLYSVFKLPLAVTVLKRVEAGKLRLDQKVTVDRDDVSSGGLENTSRWRNAPLAMTIKQLLELSIEESDNTSSDKLLGLVGGPAAVTAGMRAAGIPDIDVLASIKELHNRPDHPNRAKCDAIVRLLATLQHGKILKPAEHAVLFELMTNAHTGQHRLRGKLPPGTPVMDKTGTGPAASATNDVGIITLPHDQGHVAVAVLISASKLSADEQERTIADIGLAAYQEFARRP